MLLDVLGLLGVPLGKQARASTADSLRNRPCVTERSYHRQTADRRYVLSTEQRALQPHAAFGRLVRFSTVPASSAYSPRRLANLHSGAVARRPA